MMMGKILDFSHYSLLVAEYGKKGVLTNNYMMPSEVEGYLEEGRLRYVATESNMALLLDKGVCQRMYYYLQNQDEIMELPASAKYSIEILYRGDKFYPQREISYWQKCGFEIHLIRDFYTGVFSDMQLLLKESDVSISLAETEEEVRFALNLFNSIFDPYTGDYMSDEEIPVILREGRMSIAKFGGEIVGGCHAYEKNKSMYLGHLAVTENARGKAIGRQLMQEMIERLRQGDKTRYSLWVQRNNVAAVSLYLSLGYKYSNKSTISLLKLQ